MSVEKTALHNQIRLTHERKVSTNILSKKILQISSPRRSYKYPLQEDLTNILSKKILQISSPRRSYKYPLQEDLTNILSKKILQISSPRRSYKYPLQEDLTNILSKKILQISSPRRSYKYPLQEDLTNILSKKILQISSPRKVTSVETLWYVMPSLDLFVPWRKYNVLWHCEAVNNTNIKTSLSSATTHTVLPKVTFILNMKCKSMICNNTYSST